MNVVPSQDRYASRSRALRALRRATSWLPEVAQVQGRPQAFPWQPERLRGQKGKTLPELLREQRPAPPPASRPVPLREYVHESLPGAGKWQEQQSLPGWQEPLRLLLRQVKPWPQLRKALPGRCLLRQKQPSRLAPFQGRRE